MIKAFIEALFKWNTEQTCINVDPVNGANAHKKIFLVEECHYNGSNIIYMVFSNGRRVETPNTWMHMETSAFISLSFSIYIFPL